MHNTRQLCCRCDGNPCGRWVAHCCYTWCRHVGRRGARCGTYSCRCKRQHLSTWRWASGLGSSKDLWNTWWPTRRCQVGRVQHGALTTLWKCCIRRDVVTIQYISVGLERALATHFFRATHLVLYTAIPARFTRVFLAIDTCSSMVKAYQYAQVSAHDGQVQAVQLSARSCSVFASAATDGKVHMWAVGQPNQPLLVR